MEKGTAGMPQRIRSVDIVGGILILWIMVFHALDGSEVFGEDQTRRVLPYLTFSMPWFFYRSGLFFHILPWRERLAKDIRKLLIPFLKWSALGFLIWLAMQAIDGTLTRENCLSYPLQTLVIYGFLPVNIPIWFLLTLFLVRFGANCLLQWSVPPLVCVVAGLGIGYGLHLLDSPIVPFVIANTAMGIAFFMLGYRFGQYEHITWLSAAAIAGYAAFLAFGCSIVNHHNNRLITGNYLLWPVFAYCGIVTFNNLCRWADSIMSSRGISCRILPFIGKHSLTLLATHAFVYFPILHYSTFGPWQTVGIIIAAYLVVFIPVLWAKREKEPTV